MKVQKAKKVENKTVKERTCIALGTLLGIATRFARSRKAKIKLGRLPIQSQRS